ncbi:MBOAT family O-acyltransferase [Lachnotalea glycerini]|uniref:MBOAT family protein n=1 Tax=Lachnotalea glycerini TaxID=1763509 RepID=A0A371JG56_9FIRM|nr:MBOAT family O-acyltransferase [Lachnotalea glycerini]RDY31708.1 hypothetical protein CG710_008285 [Lachnotalea glycerini]
MERNKKIMELMSGNMVGVIVIALILVSILPEKRRGFILAFVSMYILFINNSFSNFMLTLLLLLGVYGGAISIEKKREKALVICRGIVILLVLILTVMKYSNFIITLINVIFRVLGSYIALKTFHINAPFGISYFTLILIAYVLSVYWGTVKAKIKLEDFVNTVGFFPIWFIGPILSGGDMIDCNFRVTYHSLTFGLQRIGWGMFKKMLISGPCAVLVNTIYCDYRNYSGLYILIAIALFELQLYTDFSGAMDIVLGIAEIFGKKLPENFNRPFSSTSVSEFWRRWHITLGIWLKNFVLYPILKTQSFIRLGEMMKKLFGKKLGKRIVTYLGLFISWFLIGLWHGGGWNYIFGVGIYMWLIIVGGEILQPLFDGVTKHLCIKKSCGIYILFSKIRTAVLVLFGIHFFRAGSLKEGFRMIKFMVLTYDSRVLLDGSLVNNLGIAEKPMIICFLGTVIFFLISNLQKSGSVRERIAKQNIIIRWGIYYLLIMSIAVLGPIALKNGVVGFIYQQF